MQRKILIVDDNDVNRQILRRILKDEYEVMEAADGRAALDVLNRQYDGVSAVLLDVVMPVMNGYEVLEEMRQNPNLSQIPVIVTTGNTEEGAEVKALSLGANDYILKPYNPAIIRHRLWNTINLRETAALANLAKWDRLTGLYSREAFLDKAGEMIHSHEPGYYIIACFDIDNFKVINDQYGSARGDEVLQSIAEVFREGFRPVGGICCRVMADIFAVLYPHSFANSEEIAEIRQKAAQLGNRMPSITFSVGRYLVDDLSLSVSAMLDRAAIAETSVKGRYDLQVAQYDESMRERILREQRIVNEMNGALEQGQFEIWLQPQYNHSTGALIGAEALVRWRHPEKGLIPPGVFIPVFERNGFIYELDKFVWEQVCATLRKWIDAGASPMPLSVNISRYDLFRDDLIDVVTGLIHKYDLPLDLLRLEITESAFAQSAEQIIGVVEKLVQYGFTVEIDDFGSGYSSLNTLKDVPASVLKLDMRFLESGRNSCRGGNILESIVRMAKWLGMPVIAEGVETMEQAEFLKSIGCFYVQGYLYARPMPVPEYEALAAGIGKEKAGMSGMKTVETLDNNAFWDPKSMETLIFNSYVGGASIFEYHGGNIELLRINDKYAQEVLGADASLEEALSVDMAQHADDSNRAALLQGIAKAVETGEEAVCEVCLRNLPRRSGDTYLRLAARVIARAGERRLLYGTVINITAERENERRILEASERIRFLNETLTTLMDDTPGGFARILVPRVGHAQMIYCNGGFCKLVGATLDEVMALDGVDAMERVHPDDRETVRTTVRGMEGVNETCSLKFRLRYGGGGYERLTVFGRLARSGSGDAYLNLYYACEPLRPSTTA